VAPDGHIYGSASGQDAIYYSSTPDEVGWPQVLSSDKRISSVALAVDADGHVYGCAGNNDGIYYSSTPGEVDWPLVLSDVSINSVSFNSTGKYAIAGGIGFSASIWHSPLDPPTPTSTDLPFPSSWSMIGVSSNAIILQAADINIVYSYTSTGYTPIYPDSNNNINLLANQGYWINFKTSTTITVNGTTAPANISLELPSSWSMIGVSNNSIILQNANINIVYSYTSTGYTPIYPDSSNNINLLANQGYWINCKMNTTIYINRI
jgi:hypothetical protein